jgi:hypothetical protein
MTNNRNIQIAVRAVVRRARRCTTVCFKLLGYTNAGRVSTHIDDLEADQTDGPAPAGRLYRWTTDDDRDEAPQARINLTPIASF